MIDNRYTQLLLDALAMLDPEEYPGIYSFIASSVDNYEGPNFDAMDFVDTLNSFPEQPQLVWNLIVEILELEIENGNPDAMNELGTMYYLGEVCEQDYTKAVYYYTMAAEHGNRQAQENLGYCYYYGRNMPVDYEKAFHYFALGAFDGHHISLYKIGDMYANGYYVKKNETEAFHIYERCLETMTDEAAAYAAGPVYLRLGNMFLNGCGTEANAETALVCFQKAEVFLFGMMKNGDKLYRKSLRDAIDGQMKARRLLEMQFLDIEVNEAAP